MPLESNDWPKFQERLKKTTLSWNKTKRTDNKHSHHRSKISAENSFQTKITTAKEKSQRSMICPRIPKINPKPNAQSKTL